MGSEWRECTLGDFVRIQRGHDLTELDRHPGKVPVMGSAGHNGYHNRALAKGPGVVIGRSGASFGKVHFCKDDYWPHNTALYVTDFLGNNPVFAYYLLRCIDFAGFNSGSAQPSLNRNFIYPIKISVPPLKEQEDIGRLIRTLDDKITLNRQTNATLEAIAQALFKSWFVDFDPVRAKMEGREPEGMDEATAALFPSEFVESELGLIPEGWDIGILGDVCRNYREGVMPENIEPCSPYIGLEHMPRKSISLNEWGVSKGLESGKFKFLVGDILFGKLRPYFHKVGTAPIDGVCSTDILVIRPKTSDWYGFSLGHFSSSALIDYAEKLSNGAKMPRTNWSDLSKYRVVLPDSKTAKILSDFFESVVYKIRENITQSRTLAEIHDALLPKLISGQLRIPEAEEVIEDCTA